MAEFWCSSTSGGRSPPRRPQSQAPMTAFAKEGAGQDEDGSGTHAAPAMSGQSCRPHTAHNDTGSQAPGAHVHGRRKSRCSRTRKQRRVWGTVGRCGSVHWREVMPLEPSALTVWSVVSTVVCPCRCRRRGRVYASAVSLQVFPGATIGCEQLKADPCISGPPCTAVRKLPQ